MSNARNVAQTVVMGVVDSPRPDASQGRAWRSLSRADRSAIAAGSLAALALLLALVQTCEESIRKGELLRAEQRQMVLSPAAEVGTRTASVAATVASGL